MLPIKLYDVLTDGEKTGRGQYRQYSHDALENAFNAVIINKLSLRRAANKFSVPFSTLKDRVSGKNSVDCVTSGREPLFTIDEENSLVKHIDSMAKFGYGYTRSEVTSVATELAIHLGKRTATDSALTQAWFYGFLRRWPDLHVTKPRPLELQRAKATSAETIDHYFKEFETILDKYDLKNSPHKIYNVDEKGLVEHHVPPSVVCSQQSTPSAVVAPRSSTTTVIGCGNAAGHSIPPYFVFKGQRMRDELMSKATPGAPGTVSESGLSNSAIFHDYLKNHFLKYAVAASDSDPLLVLYDGHKSHVSLPLIEWARSNHIVLFVLPAHTSHVLQPMDVGCFGPFAKVYNNLRHKYMRENATGSVDRHSICELECKAYNMALTPTNLQSSFRKCGIYPFDKSVSTAINCFPATVFKTASSNHATERDLGDMSSSCTSSLDKKISVLDCKSAPTKTRKVLSAVVGGKAITEEDTLQKIISHHSTQKVARTNSTKVQSPQPGPSGVKTVKQRDDDVVDSDDDDVDLTDDIPCCKCMKSVPDAFRNSTSIKILSWAQCDFPSCGHWTHLKFCTEIRVVRRHSQFFCPCHDQTEE